MSLNSLPPELLDTIFEPLSANALTALARASRHFNPCATRLLYRHIALSSVARNLPAVDTLASRPQLSALVRTFSITIEDRAVGLDASYHTRLSIALRGMRGITSLEVHVDAGLSWVLPSLSPLADLRHFSCSFGLDKYVASFLACTPSLRSLQLAPSPDNVELSPSVIPHLRHYTGPPNLLAQLLPARPLTSLHLCSDLTLDDIAYFTHTISAPSRTLPTHKHPQVSEGVTASHTAIETLSTITSAQPVAVVEAIAQACPSLVSLQVIASYAFWQAPDMTFYTRIANALSLMPRLCSFELSGMHWEFRPKATLTADGTCMEKEWVSPPVTPRLDAVEELDTANDFDFEEAFMEWAY